MLNIRWVILYATQDKRNSSFHIMNEPCFTLNLHTESDFWRVGLKHYSLLTKQDISFQADHTFLALISKSC